MGRKDKDDDNDSVLTIKFPSDSKPKNSDRSVAQEDQLARARHTALTNRRIALKKKLENRLAELRQQLGDLSNESMARLLQLLVDTEDKHRTKLNAAVEEQNSTLRHLFDEIHSIKKGFERKRIANLSEVSSVSRQ